MAKEIKPIYRSKTFYFGLLWVVVGIANYFGFADYQPDSSFNEISQVGNGIIIVFLRYITSEPVKIK